MRRAGLVLVALAAAAFVACGGSGAEPTPTPGAASTAAVAQSIVTSDGVRLSAYLFEADSDARIAILSHQYGADQSSWFEAAQRLQASGISALTFDFRGFGESGGDEDPDTLTIDLDAAVAYAHGRGYERILLIGASMGGTASIVVAGTGGEAATGVEGVIALSAPIEFGKLHAEEAAASMRVPLLLIAGEGDTSAHDSLERFGDAAHVAGSNRLVIAGAAHGTELLDSPTAASIWDVIMRFVGAISAD